MFIAQRISFFILTFMFSFLGWLFDLAFYSASVLFFDRVFLTA